MSDDRDVFRPGPCAGGLPAGQEYTILHFTPFDPVSKRTIAKVKDKEGNIFRVCKGAPQVVLSMAYNSSELQQVVKGKITDFASRGYRALGTAEGPPPRAVSAKLVADRLSPR